MKVTVEFSDSEMEAVCAVSGESKKGPAIRKVVLDTLRLKRREALAQKFIDGDYGTELDGCEEAREKGKQIAKTNASLWRD